MHLILRLPALHPQQCNSSCLVVAAISYTHAWHFPVNHSSKMLQNALIWSCYFSKFKLVCIPGMHGMHVYTTVSLWWYSTLLSSILFLKICRHFTKFQYNGKSFSAGFFLLLGFSRTGSASGNACANSWGRAMYWSWRLYCMWAKCFFNLDFLAFHPQQVNTYQY